VGVGLLAGQNALATGSAGEKGQKKGFLALFHSRLGKYQSRVIVLQGLMGLFQARLGDFQGLMGDFSSPEVGF
jgi:hypothetical protein